MNGMYWVTRGGVVVRQSGPVAEFRGGQKIIAYKAATGGYHGTLWLHRLRPATPHEVRRAIATRGYASCAVKVRP